MHSPAQGRRCTSLVEVPEPLRPVGLRTSRIVLAAESFTSVAPCATVWSVSTEITQRELRNDSGRIMRSLREGATFVVTSHGEPVGELLPLRRRRFVSSVAVSEGFRGVPPVESDRFFKDLDSVVSQDIDPLA